MRSAGTVHVRASKSISSRADDFAGARAGQDRELQRASRDTLLRPQLRHERGDLGIGQRRVMLNPAHLGFLRQQVFQMAAPARWIFALAPTPRGRVIENAFDPAADPRSRLGLLGPDRFERPHDQPDINRANRQIAEHRVDVGFEC